ncbi:MAG: hypothetical protein E7Y34_01955 [Mycoplasma sp.]|nr:hypothetical protein [Mycoplasma sp.]
MAEYYDISVLKTIQLPIDRLIRFVIGQNPQLENYQATYRFLNLFFEITPRLVRDFQSQAVAHIRHVLDNMSQYGHLYLLIDQQPLFNALEWNDEEFILSNEEVLDPIRKMASQFFPKDSAHYHITCIYLLYFYALLANPKYTWITMDYLMHGNKYHQYLLAKHAHEEK